MEKSRRGSVPRGYQTARERCRVSVIDATPRDKQRTVDALAPFGGRLRYWATEFDVRGLVVERKRLVGIASVEYPPVTLEMRASGIWTAEARPYGEQELGVTGRDERIPVIQLPGGLHQRP